MTESGGNADRPQPDAAAVGEELERIFASASFDATPRSRAFLRFIVDETLAGRQASLTQATIATLVFGRRDDFDPTIDPIVRIQAGRLRRSLERYYLLAGVADPVRIGLPSGTYVPTLGWAPAGVERDRERDTARPAVHDDGWPSVLLRPFEAENPDPAEREAARHLHDHLAVELGRYRDVRVVVQQGQVDPRAFGERSFALLGHLGREDGEGPRVTLRLVRCLDERQVWGEEYRGGPGTTNAFHEETARVVAARVASEHGVVAWEILAEHGRRPRAEPTPYDAVLQSYRYFLLRDPAVFGPAVEALQRAVATEPECSLAWTQLSRLYSANFAFEVAPVQTPVDQAVTFAQNAVHLDPTSRRASGALIFALFLKGELAASRAEAERTLALNPESLVYREGIGWLLALLGDWDRGLTLVREAMRRNPHHMGNAFHALWLDHLRRGEMDEAYRAALLYRDPVFLWGPLMRACSLGHLGRLPEAQQEARELLALQPAFPLRGRILIDRIVKPPDLQETVVAGLRKAGLTVA